MGGAALGAEADGGLPLRGLLPLCGRHSVFFEQGWGGGAGVQAYRSLKILPGTWAPGKFWMKVACGQRGVQVHSPFLQLIVANSASSPLRDSVMRFCRVRAWEEKGGLLRARHHPPSGLLPPDWHQDRGWLPPGKMAGASPWREWSSPENTEKRRGRPGLLPGPGSPVAEVRPGRWSSQRGQA